MAEVVIRSREAARGSGPGNAAPKILMLPFLKNRAVFGDPTDEPRLVEPYREALASLHEASAPATVK